jgi:hypothetical protein
MKKALLITLALLCIATFVNAKDYIGVYFDTIHTACTKSVTGYVGIYYYIWVLPEPRGLTAVEFKIVFPGMINPEENGGLTLNPGINLTLGDVLTGWSATFASCTYGWTQVYRQRVFPDPDVEPNGYIQIVKTDDSQNLGLSTCEMQDMPFTVLNHGAINLPCIIGTKDASWGAIKSLF